jgi:hypothetical protein
MPTHRTPPVARLGAVAALAVSLLLTGCGDDGDDETSTDETTTEAGSEETTTTASPVDEAASGEVEDGVLTVELADYAFEGLPESVPAGTRLAVENTSSEELHEMVAFRLPDGEERSAEELVALPEEELGALFAGPPATVLLAPPGGEQIDAVGDGTLAEPGSYVLFCSIPTGADPEAFLAAAEESGDGPPATMPGDGPPHFAHGMYADLVVE